MAKVKDVISRIGLYTGSNEQNKVKKYNIRKIMYFNHLNLYLQAPNIMAERYMKDTSLTPVPKSATYYTYLDLTSIPDVIKDITAVSSPGSAAYTRVISREHFDNLVQFSEDVENGRFFHELRGTGDIGGIGRVLLYQGTDVQDTDLYLQYTRQMNTGYADDNQGTNDDEDFDAPEELLELFILMCGRDVMMETNNKEGVKEVRQLIDEQKGLLTQLDTLRQTRSQALEQANRDR